MKLLLRIVGTFLFAGAIQAYAQPKLYPTNYPRITTKTGDTLVNPYVGAFTSPMFNAMDLNGDGISDLVVFDRVDSRVYTFLGVNMGSQNYRFAPQYIAQFPRGREFYMLRDMNGDGKLDVFTHSSAYNRGAHIAVFKNVGTIGNPAFAPYSYELEMENRNGLTTIYAAPVEMPCIEDMDMDGDLDVVLFDGLSNTTINYFRNMAVEKLGRKDTMMLWLNDQCYGAVREESLEAKYYLGHVCGQTSTKREARLHAGGSLAAMDLDNDKDMDLLISDIDVPNVFAFTNGRISDGIKVSNRDTMVSQLDNFPPNGTAVEVANSPIVAFIKLDADTFPDMIVSTGSINDAQAADYVWYYQNQPKTPAFHANFQLQRKDFLIHSMVELGSYSQPAFADVNGDGLEDLIVSTNGARFKGDKAHARLVLYMQKKNAQNQAYYSFVTDNYMDMQALELSQLKTNFIDADKDGALDMMIGNEYGNVMYYKGSKQGNDSLTFTEVTQALQYDDNGTLTDIALSSCYPTGGFISSASGPDLLIGTNSGSALYWYAFKEWKDGKPVFILKGSDYFQVNAVPGRGTINNLTPYLYKQNDTLKLVMGSSVGLVYTGLPSATSMPMQANDVVQTWNAATNAFVDSALVVRATPAVSTSLGAAGQMQMIVGGRNGGLMSLSTSNLGYDDVFVGINTGPKPEPVQRAMELQVYPNPAQQTLTVVVPKEMGQASQTNLSITNMVGQTNTIPQRSMQGDKMMLDVSALPNGIYVLTMRSGSATTATPTVATSRIVIQK